MGTQDAHKVFIAQGIHSVLSYYVDGVQKYAIKQNYGVHIS